MYVHDTHTIAKSPVPHLQCHDMASHYFTGLPGKEIGLLARVIDNKWIINLFSTKKIAIFNRPVVQVPTIAVLPLLVGRSSSILLTSQSLPLSFITSVIFLPCKFSRASILFNSY